jgi:hypothetical protein
MNEPPRGGQRTPVSHPGRGKVRDGTVSKQPIGLGEVDKLKGNEPIHGVQTLIGTRMEAHSHGYLICT